MKILFIQTGGTIDKDYPKLTSGYAFEIGKSVVPDIIQKLNPSFTYDVVTCAKKDSSELTEEDRKELYNLVLNFQEDKIIITHGTDTILETAKYLQQIKDKKVILTGAMRPQKFTNSDADINIGTAIGAIQHIANGIYIAMHGIVKKASLFQRNLETGQYY